MRHRAGFQLPSQVMEAIETTAALAAMGRADISDSLGEKLTRRVKERMRHNGRATLAVGPEGDIIDIGDNQLELERQLTGVETVAYLFVNNGEASGLFQ